MRITKPNGKKKITSLFFSTNVLRWKMSKKTNNTVDEDDEEDNDLFKKFGEMSGEEEERFAELLDQHRNKIQHLTSADSKRDLDLIKSIYRFTFDNGGAFDRQIEYLDIMHRLVEVIDDTILFIEWIRGPASTTLMGLLKLDPTRYGTSSHDDIAMGLVRWMKNVKLDKDAKPWLEEELTAS